MPQAKPDNAHPDGKTDTLPAAGALSFSFWGDSRAEIPNRLRAALEPYLQARGFQHYDRPPDHVRVVFNLVDAERCRPYRRKAQATFVVSWVQLDRHPGDVLKAGYPLLIRSLSNLLVLFVPGAGRTETHFITPEQGHYQIHEPLLSPEYLDAFYRRLEPIITSQLVIDNVFDTDLPEELWYGDEKTEQLF